MQKPCLRIAGGFFQFLLALGLFGSRAQILGTFCLLPFRLVYTAIGRGNGPNFALLPLPELVFKQGGKMKTLIFCSAIFLAAAASITFAAERQPAWTKKIRATEGNYRVNASEQDDRVEVVRLNGQSPAPSHLRMRVLRKNDSPLEVTLKTIEPQGNLPRYAGNASLWNQSVIGIQLEFSFDQKVWKRLGRTIRLNGKR